MCDIPPRSFKVTPVPTPRTTLHTCRSPLLGFIILIILGLLVVLLWFYPVQLSFCVFPDLLVSSPLLIGSFNTCFLSRSYLFIRLARLCMLLLSCYVDRVSILRRFGHARFAFPLSARSFLLCRCRSSILFS